MKKKVPKPQIPRTQSELDDSEYESESENFEWRRWPANAYRDDAYYGCAYDSGGHRICKSLSSSLCLIPLAYF